MTQSSNRQRVPVRIQISSMAEPCWSKLVAPTRPPCWDANPKSASAESTDAPDDLIPRLRLDTPRVRSAHLLSGSAGNLQQHLWHKVCRLRRDRALYEAGLLDHSGRGSHVRGEHDQLPGAARKLALALHCLHSVSGRGGRGRQEISGSKALDSTSRWAAFSTLGVGQACADSCHGEIFQRGER